MDGLLDAVRAEEVRAHLAACARCARYDRVLRQGLKKLAAFPQLETASDFTLRLEERLGREDRRLALRPITSLATASVAVAAMLAFAAWLPVLLLSSRAEPQLVSAPASAVVSEIAWHGESAVENGGPAHVHQVRRVAWSPSSSGHVIEAKYTPVILESPIAPLTYARTVSLGAE